MNEGGHLFSSLTGRILIFAAIVCLWQLLATYALLRKTKSDEPLNFTIVATMEYLGLAMVFFGSIVLFWVISELPYLHFYNLGHVGLIGFSTTVFTMVGLRVKSENVSHWEQYFFAVFLGAVPCVYLRVG